MPLLSANLNIMEKACKKASKLLIRDFGEVEKLQVSKKGPGDFVTNSDKRTEKIIINELSLARPDYSFLAEESGSSGKSNEFRWIIDPIDGTTNFLHGIPYFAISIGLEKNKEIICGMIFNPITNEMFYAEKGKGAYLNNSRIRVSSRKNIDECVLLTGDLFFLIKIKKYFLKSMNLLAEELLRLGNLVAQRWILLILLAEDVMRYGKET